MLASHHHDSSPWTRYEITFRPPWPPKSLAQNTTTKLLHAKWKWPPGLTLVLRLMGLPGPYMVSLSFWGKFLRAKYFSLLMTLVCLYIYGKDQLVNSSCNNNRILIVLQLLCSLAQSTIICAMLIKIKVQFYSQTMMCFKASNEIFFIHICTSENFTI